MLAKGKAFWGITVVVAIGLVVAIEIWRVDSNPTELQAAAAVNTSAVSIDGLRCLSIDPRKVVVDQKEYWGAGLVEAIADTLPVKAVLLDANYETCPWGFFVTVVPGLISAVQYHGRSARYLVSIGVCERIATGTLIAGKCLNKNIYIFNSDVEPRDLLLVALAGLARSQVDEWEVFQTTKPK
jgi:hypothetical protein